MIKSGREYLADLRLSTKLCNLISGLFFCLLFSYLCLKANRLPTRLGRAGEFWFVQDLMFSLGEDEVGNCVPRFKRSFPFNSRWHKF